MLDSQVIEVDGTFVGAAVTVDAGFRFHAVHATVQDLDRTTWPSLDELEAAARTTFTTGRSRTLVDAALRSAALSMMLASTTRPSSWMT